MTRRFKAPTKLELLRRQTHRALHDQLDALLDSITQMPDGTPGTVIEDIMARQLVGYGFSVGIQVAHPQAPGQVPDDPPPSLIVTP